MSQITSRIYEGEKDFHTIIDLLTKLRPAKHLNDYPVKVDIEENLAAENIQANTRIWFNDGQPIAWAYLDDFNNLRWEIDSQYDELIGAELVAWGESCIRRTSTDGEANTLDASCREDYAERISFLKRHGFHQTEGTSIAMTRDLSVSIPEPKLPQGFTIRPIQGMEEAEAVASTHRAAFGTDYMTTENRLTIMNTSEYDPSLDLLAIAPDGTVTAYCTCSVNEKEKTGMTDPVATHPNYQRMGLARALLLTGMKLLKERGMASAHLGTSGDNVAMQKTAESVDFKVEYTTIWFSKEIN
ncbi:MAG: GNAT family N-acetyltransferase [Anaerolineales bacterium]|nr:GNAT family N-acetyltransferase [Anaerolineales bacterium]